MSGAGGGWSFEGDVMSLPADILGISRNLCGEYNRD